MTTSSRTRFAAMVLTLAWIYAAPAAAATVAIDNPSFELPATGPGTFVTNAPPTDWQAYGASLNFVNRTVGVVNPSGTTLYTEPVPEGSNLGVIFLMPSAGTEAGMQQTLAATLQTMTDYTLTVEIGNMGNDPDPPHNSFNFSGFPGYRVDLLAGTTVIASDNNTLLPPEGGLLTSTVSVSIGATHPNAGEALTIRLVNLDGPNGIEVNFDEVALDASPAAECPETIPSGCKNAASGKGSLKLSRRAGDPDASRAGWSWKGDETLDADLGDPTATSAYRLCVYDGGGDAVLNLEVAAGGSCGSAPCWKETASGFAFKDSAGSGDGVTSLKLKSGEAGKAQIKLKARGAGITMPGLPLVIAPDPVTAVLVNLENDECWTASYSAVLGDPASATKWQSKND